MPTLSVYVNDAIYRHLLNEGTPSAVAKEWIEDRYENETTERM